MKNSDICISILYCLQVITKPVHTTCLSPRRGEVSRSDGKGLASPQPRSGVSGERCHEVTERGCRGRTALYVQRCPPCRECHSRACLRDGPPMARLRCCPAHFIRHRRRGPGSPLRRIRASSPLSLRSGASQGQMSVSGTKHRQIRTSVLTLRGRFVKRPYAIHTHFRTYQTAERACPLRFDLRFAGISRPSRTCRRG